MSRNFVPVLVTAGAALCLAPACSHDAADQIPVNELAGFSSSADVLYMDTRVIGDQEITTVKYIGDDGDIEGKYFDELGEELLPEQLPSFKRPFFGPLIEQALDRAERRASVAGDEQHDVILVLYQDIFETTGPPSTGTVTLEAGRAPEMSFNGHRVTPDELSFIAEQELIELAYERQRRLEDRRLRVEQLMTRKAWQDRPEVQKALVDGRSTIHMVLHRSELEDLFDNDRDLVEAVELYTSTEPSIAGALAAMRVDSYAHAYGHRGQGVGIYMSESGGYCPSNTMMNTGLYTNINGASPGTHANMVGNIVAATAPSSHVFCGAADSVDPNPGSRNPEVYVSTHSFNWYDDNTAYRSQDRDWDNSVYDDRVSVFVSAGNTKSYLTTKTVLTPSKAFNVMTLGNYNDSNSTMNASSLYEDPDPGNEKPEIVAPGTGIVTAGGTCTGTSCSTPFAAGFAADLMGAYDWLRGRPERVKALMLAGATDNIEGNAALSEIDGAGGIDYRNSGWSGSNTYWTGNNGSHFDASNRVTTTRSLTGGARYRIALAWLVPGSYAYSNSNVNMDLDLRVYNPSGSVIAGSYSLDNGFEIVDFTAPSTGTYTVEVHRFWNSGTGDVIMAVHSQRVY